MLKMLIFLVHHFMREKILGLHFTLSEFHLEWGSFLLQWKGAEWESKSEMSSGVLLL